MINKLPVIHSVRNILAAALSVLTIQVVSAGDLPRERVSMDFGWRFHLGEAPDAGGQFNYPEVKDLAKTHADEVGMEGTLAAALPDPPLEELGRAVSFVQPDFDDSQW